MAEAGKTGQTDQDRQREREAVEAQIAACQAALRRPLTSNPAWYAWAKRSL